MIKAASVGLGWWSNELAESIQDKSKKIKRSEEHTSELQSQ